MVAAQTDRGDTALHDWTERFLKFLQRLLNVSRVGLDVAVIDNPQLIEWGKQGSLIEAVREKMHRCAADGERPKAGTGTVNSADVEGKPNHGNIGTGNIAGGRDTHEGIGTAGGRTKRGSVLPVGWHITAVGHDDILNIVARCHAEPHGGSPCYCGAAFIKNPFS